jgi:hypothetical protein
MGRSMGLELSAKALVSAGVALSVLAFSVQNARAGGYIIEEMTDYSKCCQEEPNLPAATETLPKILQSKGWAGNRYVNGNVWPQDITESCSADYGANGIDSAYGDANDLLVLSGHGNTGVIGYGAVHAGICAVDLRTGSSDTNVARLGQMSGGRTSIAIWLTCCTLRKDKLPSRANYQWVKQQIGYSGESAMTNDMMYSFVRNSGMQARVGYISNVEAWMVSQEDAPGWFTGDNSPIVVSYGKTSAEANANHANMTMDGWNAAPRTGGPACGGGPPRFYYTYTLRDHGVEGCN